MEAYLFRSMSFVNFLDPCLVSLVYVELASQDDSNCGKVLAGIDLLQECFWSGKCPRPKGAKDIFYI